MAELEIVNFWYNTKARLLAIIIHFLKKVQLFNLLACEWICQPSLYLYSYMIAQVSFGEQTECSHVNRPELIMAYNFIHHGHRPGARAHASNSVFNMINILRIVLRVN